MWDLPGPGLELVSPALAGITTVPTGKSLEPIFLMCLVEKYASAPEVAGRSMSPWNCSTMLNMLGFHEPTLCFLTLSTLCFSQLGLP